MSLMAGFDIVIEVSRATLLNLIKANLQLQGVPLAPPFQIDIPIVDAGQAGTANLIVTDVKLSLNGGTDTVTVTLVFEDTTISIGAQTISALDGTIDIRASVQIVPTGGAHQQSIGVNFGQATAPVNFSPHAKGVIAQKLKGSGLGEGQFEDLANQAVITFVHSLGIVVLQANARFTVVPGTDGLLAPLQFEKLSTVRCIGDQALAIFGILLAANDANGDAAQKTTTAIKNATLQSADIGHDICVSISPEAFRQLIFCPDTVREFVRDETKTSTPAGLKAAIATLPSCCGSAGSVEDNHGVQFTRICDTFADGHINIDGNFQKSGFCYDATGSFHNEITLAISGTTITASISQDKPNINISMPFLCQAAWALLNVLSIFIGSEIGRIVSRVLSSIASHSEDPRQPPPPVNLTGFANARFDDLATTLEGLSMNGNVPVRVPASPFERKIEIQGAVSTNSSAPISNGIYNYQGSPDCAAKSFPYIEVSQQQSGVFHAIPTLMGRPLKIEWFLEIYKGIWGFNTAPELISRVALDQSNGLARLTSDVRFPLPLPGGAGVTGRTVEIGYSVNNDVVTLTNTSTDGNYNITLHVKATDPASHVVENVIGVAFTGVAVQIGGGFDDYMRLCQIASRNRISKIRTIPQSIPLGGDPGSLENLAELTQLILSQGGEEIDQLLSDLQVSYGEAFQRAVFSPGAFQKQGVPRLRS
jgi:hypothetical protein